MDYRSGWGYSMLTWGLWDQGNGRYTLHAIAVDTEGQIASLGSTSIEVDNRSATLPFDTIDTPAPSATVNGRIVNFGWALTPLVNGQAICTIPPSGVQVSVDWGPLQA